MADAQTNWIDFYISLTPVAQTGIWAGVAVSAILVLRKPLQQLGDELVRRVNQGDTVTTPWLSLEQRQERERRVVEQVTENVRKEIKAPTASQQGSLSTVDDAEIDALLEKVGNRFVDIVFPASDFVTVRRQDMKTSLYVTDWAIVSDFLNATYNAAIEGGVELPIWSYGRHWRFKNQRTGEYVEKARKGVKIDSRPFDELGIIPGDVLVAERIR